MKIDTPTIGGLLCLVVADVLAFYSLPGWGWFLFIGFLLLAV